MTRFLYWAPFVVLTIGVGVYFLRLGWVAATISETEVIEAYASEYVRAMHAADPASPATKSDCFALPGEDRGVWLIVICGSSGCGEDYREYHVNRLGRFVREGQTGCPDAALRSLAA